MKQKNSNFYLFLALYFVGILLIPKTAVDKLRSFSVASIYPLWKPVFAARGFSSSSKEDFYFLSEENQRLKLENARLHNQIKAVNEWILFQERIEQQFDYLKNIKVINEKDLYWKDFFLRRAEELSKTLEGQLQALPARIIYKDLTCEADQVWINVGYYHNDVLGRLVVAKNSPVLVGNNLVGVVDKVEAKKSLVTLITDSSLPISVRAVRGETK
ncbi:MAG TPA: rod shape-determining protein MreC, partial [Chlamydiales bacterium]|nr:rod shape-determining protein MreC [Chlamydiales bacterium]